jgi:antirestriction protein ArdC
MKNSSCNKSATPKPTIYQTVTARIIESLKAGIIPWAKPWQGNARGTAFPSNYRTGAPYRGINVLLLWSSPYASNHWLTFKQAQELGGTVRKGETGTQIVFWKKLAKATSTAQPATPNIEDETEDRARFLCRAYTVFNVEQCDGISLPAPILDRPQVDTDELCESIVQSWEGRPTLQLENEHEGRAFYRPATDAVHMPMRNRFVDTAHYYSTLFHELIHSTGHESRLARTFGAQFGDDQYSREELIAETGAAFLATIAGIANEATEKNTTAYIQNWIKALEGDSRLMITAAAAAQRAVDVIIGNRLEEQDTVESTEEVESANILRASLSELTTAITHAA